MYRKLRVALSMLHQGLFYTTFLLTISCFFPQGMDPGILWFLIPVLTGEICLFFFHQIWQLFAIHIAFLVLPFFTGSGDAEWFFSEVFLLFLFVVRYVEASPMAAKRTISDPSIVCLICYILMTLVNEAAFDGNLLTHFLIVMVIELLIYLLHKFLLNMSDFVENHRRLAELPLEQIKQVNHGMLLAFLAITVVFLILARFSGLDKLVIAILYMLLQVLRFIFSFLPDSDLPEENFGLSSTDEPERNFGFGQAQNSSLIQFIVQIVSWIMLALIAVILIIGLYKLLSTRFSIRDKDFDKKEFIMPAGKNEKKKKREKKDALSLFDVSPSGQVRRTYIKTILKAKKKQHRLQSSLTPTELEKAVKLQRTASHDALHDLYEKARYSKDGCSKEEWNQLRNSGI